jgi:hypothetical protein
LHHHASGRRGGIDRLGQTPKSRFSLGQPLHNSQPLLSWAMVIRASSAPV